MKFANAEEKRKYLTEAPVEKLVCKLAGPTILSMLITSFYNMADTFFVGKINTQATAAVGVVFSLMAIIQAVGFFFGHGSGNYISRKLGAKEIKEAEIMSAVGFFLALLSGIIIMVVCLIFIKPLSYALGSTETILPYTITYLSIILFGAPVMTSSLVLNNQMRFQGSAFYAMIGIVSGGILNIILDPILIFGCKLGIAGAALATTISQYISFFLLLILIRKGGNVPIRVRNFKLSFHYLKEVIRGGFPSLCRQGLASVATICLNHMAGFYGDAAIAGMSIVTRISMFANSALIGFGQGFQPVCGFNYGASKYKRVLDAFWFCVKYAFLFLVVVSAAGFVFAPELVALFRKDDLEVIKIGTAALRYQVVVFPFGAWIVMCNMMLQSIGKGLKASIVASARQGLCFLPLIFILPKFFGLAGVEICQMISDILTLAISVPIGFSVINEMKKQENT
ncbi:MAG: MATE family efflux transporter [Lachnospiraceae bacterium]|nr:MATE family efflux transporter [Lachnospiraceae bacterium]MDD6810649.1 MATE family efflux transporter [Lachnospiraceae bacterium]